MFTPRRLGEKECKVCGKKSLTVSQILGVCVDCVRDKPEKAYPYIMEAHRVSRVKYGLPVKPPKTGGGIPCNLCSNECIIGDGEKGFCGLRENQNGKLKSLTSQNQALLYTYRDPHVTNCVVGETKVILSNGKIAKISSLVEKHCLDDFSCFSMDNWKIKPNKIIFTQKFKVSKLVKIVTESGLKLILTPDHEVLVDDIFPKYVKAEELKVGDKVFCVKKISLNNVNNIPYIFDLLPDSIKIYDKNFVAWLKKKIQRKNLSIKVLSSKIGLNYSTLKSKLNPKTNKHLSLGEMKKIANFLGLDLEEIKKRIYVYGVKKPIKLGRLKLDENYLYLMGLIYTDGHTRENKNLFCFSNSNVNLLSIFKDKYRKLFPNSKLHEYSRPLGVKKGKVKTIVTKSNLKVLEDTNPVFVFAYKNLILNDEIPFNIGWLPKSYVGAFISGLIDGDGTLTFNPHPYLIIPFQTEEEAEVLNFLLRKLGVPAKIRFDKHVKLFKVEVRSIKSLKELSKWIKLSSEKKSKLKTIKNIKTERSLGFYEKLPKISAEVLKALRKHYKLPKNHLYRFPVSISRYEKHLRNPNSEVLKKVVDNLSSLKGDYVYEGLRKILKSNVYVEKIRSIEFLENLNSYVYDVTIENAHNFIANCIIVKNCCAAWFCPAGTGLGYPKYACKPGAEIGYSNYAVFFYGCNFNCLFCQNSDHKNLGQGRLVGVEDFVGEVLEDKRYTCICYFGGSPEPQLPFAIKASKMVLEGKGSKRIVRICFEWNGCGNPKLVREAAELALESGGNLKFDLKAFNPNLSLALSGVSNRRAYENFEFVAREFYDKRREVPVLTATTLLVPGYVDHVEVEGIAKFISELNPEIPYSLLVFHPDFMMRDLPITPVKQVKLCYEAAKKHLRNVNIGNLHLLGLSGVGF